MRHLAIHILKGVSALAINLKQQHSRMRGIKLAISLVAVCYIVIRLGKEPTELWHQLLKVDVLAGTLLAAALLLIPFNLGFEARKWQIMVRGYYPSLTFEEAFRAVLSGITVGIFTPNGVGAYAGRLLSLPSGHRTEAGARTFADRLCQMLVTLWMGLLAFEGFYQIAPKILIDLLGFGPPYLHGLRAYFVFLGICSILVVFNLHRITVVGVRLLPKSDFWNRIHYSLVHIRKKNLLQVVVLSIARFGIFSLQYLVLMYAFGYAGP
ncbi:MAG: lysylphosphatidylglycerol synthase domain-containing protein [Bacteroidota bacterium]